MAMLKSIVLFVWGLAALSPVASLTGAVAAEPEDELKKLFHIHSGGGEDTMRLQVQTFKALSE